VNSTFATSAFWQPYLAVEVEMRDEDFAAQLASLRRDFHLREETHQYEYEGKWRTFNTRTIEFAFSCGERFSLVIDYQPTANECGRELYLVDALYKTRSKMGWIDLARWHPYGLRVEELDALLAFWVRWDPRWQGSAVPLLLLCHFVGLADDEARDALTARANAALQSLNLEEAAGLPEPNVTLYVPDGDYRWEEDAELGWVFTSDEYCCYSMRNRPHVGSNHGTYPFAAFQQMMTEVRQKLDQG
jgi:hypothetical protein